jgi:hypothetical protein
MVHDFVRLAVGNENSDVDSNGSRTVEYLRRTKRAAELLLSNASLSLGLHPAVYFYSWTGKQQPILFLTMAEVVVELERRNRLNDFIRRRARLEAFMMQYRTLLNQIVRKFGTKESGKTHLKS